MKTCSKNCRVLRSVALYFTGLALLLPAACSDRDSSSGNAQGKVVIKGSNTIGEELAPRLIAEYKKKQPAVTVELESKGTASGFSGLFAGDCDIAAASRVVSNPELEQARSNHIELNVHNIGSYSVAVVVNPANAITNLSRDQVRDIFIGVTQNWKDVGGADGPIHLYIRGPISGTYLGFRELAMEDKAYAKEAKASTNYTAIADAVSKDAAGIGYVGIDLAHKGAVKAISIRGVAPDKAAINEGRYPFSRVLRLYTNRAKESPAATDFIRFVESSRGQAILEEMGFVPKP